MKIKLQNILEIEKVLEEIAFDNNIKGKYAIKLLKNLENLKAETDRFEKVRIRILEKYCDKDEDNKPIIENNSYVFNNENSKTEMAKEINELLIGETSIDIEEIPFSAIENINISMAQLSQIKDIINMEE